MEENDRLLLELAQRCKGLEPMLDAVFSFLKRKSDLYVEQAPGDRVGFPPGEAQKIVMKCFNKFASAGGPAPDKKALEAIGTRLQGDGSTPQRPDAKQLQKTAPKPSVTQNCSDATHPPVAAPPPRPASLPPTPTSNLPHYNGAALETYSWSQTLTDVTISFPLCPPCSAKNLSVTIEKSRISVHRRDGADASHALQGDLPHDIDVSESLWNVDGNVLVLHLEKHVHTWWECAIKGHPCIDTQRVDSSRHISSYDEETQAAIHKAMADQRAQRAFSAQGLPPSGDI